MPNSSRVYWKFEASHRGQNEGLLALQEVFLRAGGDSDENAPAAVGRRQALGRLSSYTKNPLLPIVVARSFGGIYEPLAYETAQALIESKSLPADSRDWIRCRVATNDFELQQLHKSMTTRIAELEDGAEPYWPNELELRQNTLKHVPPAEELAPRAEAAIATLEQLAADPQSPRRRRAEPVNNSRQIFRLVDDPEGQRLADYAAALLFKQRHLKVGKVIPELEVTLLDGTPWRIADQRGKAVIVQFSFTGCGPCAELYPHLARLDQEYGDRLEVLTILADKTPDAARKGVADGKLSWNIALDGKPGKVVQQWSITGFPTIYVVGPDGIIAMESVGVRVEVLDEAIAELLASPAG